MAYDSAVTTRVNRLPRDQRRSQLLAAAGEVFGAQGYHSAAMDDIADVAGVSKPVLYQHFGSKLDLYLALLDASCDQLRTIMTEALISTEENADRVVATIGAFYAFVSDPTGSFRLIFESDLAGDPQVQQRLARVNDDIADAVADVIVSDTHLSGDRAKLLAISMVGMAQVSARYWLDAGMGSISLTEAEHLVSTLAWRGIGGFPLVGHGSHTESTHDESGVSPTWPGPEPG